LPANIKQPKGIIIYGKRDTLVKMYRKIMIALLTLVLTTSYQSPSWAGRVLDKIKQTGEITAGARKDSIPFGYVNDKEEWVGYSLDILELIRKQTEKELGKPIKLKLVEVTPQNRFAKLKDNSIDIECGSTTFTWERDKIVDFSVSYFSSGTQLLVKKGSNLDRLEALADKKIGVVSATTNEQVIKTLQPKANLVIVKDREDGLQKLEKSEIDGFASDGILLEGLRLKADKPNNYEIVPEYPYMFESYACILPPDESDWRYIINYSIVGFMEGIVTDNSEAMKIYERWFGSQGITPYPLENLSAYFTGIINSFEWIPLEGRY
jgi:polar amino acid transport system substrate-binding protein